jgi:hypothetical protein
MSTANVFTGGPFHQNMTMEEVMRRIDSQIEVPILMQFQDFLECKFEPKFSLAEH